MEMNLEEEVSEHLWDPLRRATQQDDNPVPRRGRPFLPELWTRVISVSHNHAASFKTYELRSDLLLS